MAYNSEELADVLVKDEKIKKEIWKDIEEYEGLYQVSDLGRFKSISRAKTTPTGTKCYSKERILKQNKNKQGYLTVGLCKKGKTKRYISHRLVALTFIPNPKNKPQVNHINGDKQKNVVTNLEWCTEQENIKHAFDNGLNKRYKFEKEDLEEMYILQRKSIKEIAILKKVSECVIKRELKRNGINIREFGEAHKKYNFTKEFLQKELATKTIVKLAKEIGCDVGTIGDYKKKFNL